MAGRRRKPGEPTRREALATLIRFACDAVSPDAAAGRLVVHTDDRQAVKVAVEKLFPEAHNRAMRTADYTALNVNDNRDDDELEAAGDEDDPGDSEMFVAKTAFNRMAQIDTFTLYEITHNEGGARGITLSASVITWQRDSYEPKRWFAELYLHNTLPADRDTHGLRFDQEPYRYPWTDRLKLVEKLTCRVQQHACKDDNNRLAHRPQCGVYAEGETEAEALQHLQSLLERSRLALFHYHTGNNGRL